MSTARPIAESNNGPLADWHARLTALDPSRSFIVQAPGGSGKTELLIQRYLVLLARVEQPEEIAAITFTRKAAAEMRKRVLEALASARSDERPPEPQRALTWQHARAALARDAALGWRLEENAARLRIQTIDALCASLTRQMPVLSAFGAQPDSVEDANALYREAARATLTLLEERNPSADAVAKLLAHLDNNAALAENLLAGMLARRDHWLRNLHGARDREALEAALAAARCEAVAKAQTFLRGLMEDALPGAADVDAWQAFAATVLTREGEWRRRPPAPEELTGIEGLCEALFALTKLPPAQYAPEQWEALEAIVQVLPLAVAQLQVVFAARGKVDFVEIAQRASAALGDEDAPTDLLLSLDYRIHHLLVDEFQDTSFTQFELLAKLTAGWSGGAGGDGRTLFLVGDPMQSIYRFREAEVGLFLRARHSGLGRVELEPLTLSMNFRSQAGIVDWVNRSFRQVMPLVEDIAAGAVPYTESEPVHPPAAGAVRVHAFFDADSGMEAEAERVAELAAQARAEGTAAILVRSRSHLEEIVPRLKKRGLRFRAIEIEALQQRQVVQDLLALTRALEHPADRLAWLACLRAPWCGLRLADLHALASIPLAMDEEHDGAESAAPLDSADLFPETLARRSPSANPIYKSDIKTVWESLHDPACLARLSADGRVRAARSRDIFAGAMAKRLRASLRDRVEGAWLALGGPACVVDETDLEDAFTYLDYLEQQEEAGEIADLTAFEEGVAKLHALPDPNADASLHVMTIHKAKGLEFDTVIVPGLGEETRSDARQLFMWMVRVGADRESGLLLAPINPTGTDRDPTYEYIRDFDKAKSGHESGRLLYVAATRAKKVLHLLGAMKLGAPKLNFNGTGAAKRPSAGSLLAKLWPAVESDFTEAAASWFLATGEGGASAILAGEGSGRSAEDDVDQDLRRLPSDWSFPPPPPAASWSAPRDAEQTRDEIEFSWAGETARHVGSVAHRWMQRVAEDELRGWDRTRVEAMRDMFSQELAARGVDQTQLDLAAQRVAGALVNSLEDSRGRWLLGPQRSARNEYRLTALIDGVVRRLAIDRTFLDEEGRRWVVDYKTSQHEGAGEEQFLDQERDRYADQLRRYARAIDWRGETKLGLYFPLLAAWREWS